MDASAKEAPLEWSPEGQGGAPVGWGVHLITYQSAEQLTCKGVSAGDPSFFFSK